MDEFVVVQPPAPELKFSVVKVGGKGVLVILELEVRVTLFPAHIAVAEALTVTTGAAIITITTLYVTGLVQPLAERV